MQLNSGTPSLIEQTREYAGDPAGSPQNLFTPQLVTNMINSAYTSLRLKAGIQDASGLRKKRSYADAVEDQIFYEKPLDYHRALSIELATEGQNLATTTPEPGEILFLNPSDEILAMRLYNTGEVDSPKYSFLHEKHFGIVGPPGADQVGTNTLRLTYEASTTALVDDADEPTIPRDHHELLCVKAAIRLRVTREMDYQDLVPIHNELALLFDSELQISLDRQGFRQIPLAGRSNTRPVTKFGQVYRRS